MKLLYHAAFEYIHGTTGTDDAVVGVTSVKEFVVETEATSEALGRGAFRFTDAYSVFDWGQMPDAIDDKGAALCTMGAFNFELLEAEGVQTHYRGVVDGDAVVGLDAYAGERAPTEMAIGLTQVPSLPFDDGTYDYDAYHDDAGSNYLIPLEIVFRNRVPVGSSLRSRSLPSDHGLAFESWPEEAVELDEPIVEFSTKYEEQDRYLDREEADDIAGAVDIGELEALARTVNNIVTERAESTGFVHDDGKIECLYVDGEVRVADVVGTFDENRFSYDAQQISKEVIRQYYKATDPEWVDAVAAAKTRASEESVADWRPLCAIQPKPLPEHVLRVARNLYAAGANAYTETEWFDAPDIETVVESARHL